MDVRSKYLMLWEHSVCLRERWLGQECERTSSCAMSRQFRSSDAVGSLEPSVGLGDLSERGRGFAALSPEFATAPKKELVAGAALPGAKGVALLPLDTCTTASMAARSMGVSDG